MPEEFRVDVSSLADERRFLRLLGELDIAGSAELAECFNDIGSANVVVDLSQLEFIDCAGIGALLDAKESLASRGREMELTGARGLVLRVFELAEVASLLMG